ncbi:MAG: ABC transporter permease subunit [Promicromonosporaceae bacterium]|nr:ABC transporter permease subunit [Promicromonosporaceae bacterium]
MLFDGSVGKRRYPSGSGGVGRIWLHMVKHPMVPATRRDRLYKNLRECWQLHIFLLAATAYILIFKYYTMFGVQIAFKNYSSARGIWGSPWVGLKHFRTFFKSYYFGRVMTNTLRISIYSLVVGFPLPVLFALLLNVLRNLKIKKFVQTVTYIPYFISTVVLVGMIRQFLNPVVGIYGALYRTLGLGMYPSDLLASGNAFLHIFIWTGVWQSLGWNSIIYVAALSGVSPELHEAAMIDGANRWQRIWSVDFPAILPTIAILLILRCGSIISVGFEKVYLMQNGMNLQFSEVIATYIYKEGLSKGVRGFSYGSAIGFFEAVINFIMLVTVNMITRKISDDSASLW